MHAHREHSFGCSAPTRRPCAILVGPTPCPGGRQEICNFQKKMEIRRRSRRQSRCAHPTHVHSMKPSLIPPGRQSSISSIAGLLSDFAPMLMPAGRADFAPNAADCTVPPRLTRVTTGDVCLPRQRSVAHTYVFLLVHVAISIVAERVRVKVGSRLLRVSSQIASRHPRQPPRD